MERHVPLARTAPLRSTTTLRRGSGLAKRRFSVIDRDGAPVLPFRYSTLNPVSDKRRAENRERAAMANRRWPNRRDGTVMCAVPGCGPADDLHEIKPRGRGGSIVDEDNTIPLCRRHNSDLSQKPESELQWAHDLGLLKWSWDPDGGSAA